MFTALNPSPNSRSPSWEMNLQWGFTVFSYSFMASMHTLIPVHQRRCSLSWDAAIPGDLVPHPISEPPRSRSPSWKRGGGTSRGGGPRSHLQPIPTPT